MNVSTQKDVSDSRARQLCLICAIDKQVDLQRSWLVVNRACRELHMLEAVYVVAIAESREILTVGHAAASCHRNGAPARLLPTFTSAQRHRLFLRCAWLASNHTLDGHSIIKQRWKTGTTVLNKVSAVKVHSSKPCWQSGYVLNE